MTAIRVHKTKDFTVMSNFHLSDRNLSWKAKGMLSVMLSLPEDWDYSVLGLSSLSIDGKNSTANGLSELEANGYVKRTRAVDARGRFAGYDYDIYEIPQVINPLTENPPTDNPTTENQPQLNTNIPNTKKQSTKKLSTEELKEKCKKENPEVFDIIDFWNERSVDDKCEGGKGSVNAIKKALTKYAADEIKTAIDHYKQVINDDSYYYSYSWKIELFLVRQGGITEFFDDGSKWKNYLADKNKKKTATRPTASPDSDEAQREFHEDLKRYGLI